MGYHRDIIPKGTYGEIDKVQEETFEFVDAKRQGVKIMEMLELSDIYGALEAVASNYNLTMKDLRMMSDRTKEAFKEGKRV
jgi:phosphoribosyl-ATP pyrophosphohydrolase